MVQIAHGDMLPRHRAEKTADAGFTYGDPSSTLASRPGKDCRRAWAWGDHGVFLHVRFADVIGKATLPGELEKLDERMRVHAEGGEQTLPEIPEWLANVQAIPVPQPA